ncbi:MAG: hypothetical protein ACI9UV_000119, partial [Algoriphagus sp.]
ENQFFQGGDLVCGEFHLFIIYFFRSYSLSRLDMYRENA